MVRSCTHGSQDKRYDDDNVFVQPYSVVTMNETKLDEIEPLVVEYQLNRIII